MSELSILYVDDDRDIREIVELSLELDPGIRLRSFATGAEALETLQDDSWRPDLVLLDVMMPRMNGQTLMERLRELPGLDVPFVFITARARESDIAEYRARGASDVILKPFDPIGLAARIRGIMAAARAARAQNLARRPTE